MDVPSELEDSDDEESPYNPSKVFRRAYRPSAFIVDSIDLLFQLDTRATQVGVKLRMESAVDQLAFLRPRVPSHEIHLQPRRPS